MRKTAVILFVIVLVLVTSVAAEETKVPFSVVKSSCYGQIDMTKAEFSLLEIGKKCVKESWLEANLSEKEKNVEETEPAKNSTNKEEKEPIGSEELEKNVEQILHNVMGETVNWENKPKTLKEIDLIKQFGYEEDVYLAKISYRINDNFTKGMIRGGMVGDAMDFTEKLFNNPQASDIVECMLMPEFKMVDQYGNESEDQIAKIVVSRDLAEKINWDNMYRSRFLNLVEDEGQLWLHPAIRK